MTNVERTLDLVLTEHLPRALADRDMLLEASRAYLDSLNESAREIFGEDYVQIQEDIAREAGQGKVWKARQRLEDLVFRMTPARCEWCEGEAAYSINWECGHASLMCEYCFAPSEERDWTMDIMDWSMDPAVCPNCSG